MCRSCPACCLGQDGPPVRYPLPVRGPPGTSPGHPAQNKWQDAGRSTGWCSVVDTLYAHGMAALLARYHESLWAWSLNMDK